MMNPEVLSRAQGCLLGQLAGDALGSQVEFMSAHAIAARHPNGLCDIHPSPVWNTLAGQPTDDSEMALELARSIVRRGTYDRDDVRHAYVGWLNSHPFDCGGTVRSGLHGQPNHASQANGALMRISPLAIFGAHCATEQLDAWATQDAMLTHPHPLCIQANLLFVRAIADAIRHGTAPRELYGKIKRWAQELDVAPALLERIELASDELPVDYSSQQGWVLIAFQNALWQLLNAPSLEIALIGTAMRGGDTDTNAAIYGALLGAVHGIEAIPQRWIHALETCRPERGKPGVKQPRPERYWPIDARELATQLHAKGHALTTHA